MLSIEPAQMPERAPEVRELFSEYLEWANGVLRLEYGIVLEIGTMLEDDMHAAGKYAPPRGCLLLARIDTALAGCGCMRQIGPEVAELKRMYVRPEFRRRGIGQALAAEILDRARLAGYARIRLDSVRFMREAHALYQAAGFREVAPYAGSEIPEQYRRHWVFMERALP